MVKDNGWERLLGIARRLTTQYPDAVFIGGVAVATHANALDPRLRETSHDIALYLSLVGKSTIRDHYELTPNPRLKKDVALVDGEALDVYTERQHALAVPYDECAAFAIAIDGIRVASLEHLLVLKLDAALDPTRAASAKGMKDLRDIARILLMLRQPNGAVLDPCLSSERIALLQRLAGRGDVFRALSDNQHEQRTLRKSITRNLEALLPRGHGL